MVAKLSTTINKIQSLPNFSNSKIINEFLIYMKNNGSSERHQNNNLNEYNYTYLSNLYCNEKRLTNKKIFIITNNNMWVVLMEVMVDNYYFDLTYIYFSLFQIFIFLP
jgi:hypothetical protein